MDVYAKVEYLNSSPYDEYLLYKKQKYSFINKLPKWLKSFDKFYETRSRPLMLQCETINICTNDCIMCMYSKMKREKVVMPLEMFEKVLQDYSEMGGGYLSLTPKGGEIFLDPLLSKRLSLLRKYPKIKGVSVTTNAVPLDRFSDNELKPLLDSFIRIHVSVYGLNRKEYISITRRDHYSKMVSNVKRIIELMDTDKTQLALGIRLSKDRPKEEINDWIGENFGKDIAHGHTSTYMNWGGGLDDKIPLSLRKRIEGTAHCLYPLVMGVVFSSGDVTYCPCVDYDTSEEFKLGSIEDHSLSEIFDSDKNKELWNNLPKTCLGCSMYLPMSTISENSYIFQNPVWIIGG